MTYFGFLGIFLVIPILLLSGIFILDNKKGKPFPVALSHFNPLKAIALLVIIALTYTTLWDNYLVATGVWWYDPERVSGLIFGWVPVEEYTFFILQPIMTGLWIAFLARRLPVSDFRSRPILKTTILLLTALIWVIAFLALAAAHKPATYLGLELVWALPPILLQMVFGLEILFRHWRLVLTTILSVGLYFSLTDTLAITLGIWTIDPQQSLNIFISNLPIEEAIFFFLTTILVTFGITLLLAEDSHRLLKSLRARLPLRTPPVH